jgi:hypothetical protein
LSIPQLTSSGTQARFLDKTCHIFNPKKELIAVAHLQDSLYHLPVTIVALERAFISTSDSPSTNVAHSVSSSASLDVWHKPLGHISKESILKMMRSEMVKGIDVIGSTTQDGPTYCVECEASSHHRNPIPSETHTCSDKVLGWFSNVCEVQIVTCEGYKYFITFIDDFSRFLTIYPIRNKSDALDKFKEYLAEAEQQTGCKLKAL